MILGIFAEQSLASTDMEEQKDNILHKKRKKKTTVIPWKV